MRWGSLDLVGLPSCSPQNLLPTFAGAPKKALEKCVCAELPLTSKDIGSENGRCAFAPPPPSTESAVLAFLKKDFRSSLTSWN